MVNFLKSYNNIVTVFESISHHLETYPELFIDDMKTGIASE